MNFQNYLICLKKNKKQKQSIIIEFDYLNELAWLRYEKEAYRSAATWWVNVYIYRSGWVAKYQAHATWQSLPLFMDRFPPSPPTPFLSFFLCSPAIYEDYNWNEPGTRLHLTHPIVQSQTGWRGKRALQTDIIHIICYVKIADWKSSFVPPFIPFFLFIHPFISFFFFSWTFVLRVLQFVIVCGRPFVSGAICPAFQPTRFFLFFKWNASFWIRKENEHEKKRKQK